MTMNDITEGIALQMKKPEVQFYDETDFLDDNCFKKFPMYYSGWECDSTSWVMNDGTIFGTNHGSLCITSLEEFERYRNQMTKVAEDLDDLADEIEELILVKCF